MANSDLSALEFRPPSELHRDQELLAEAEATLHASAYPPLRTIACRVDGGVMTITGKVPSFYLKQLAQSMLMKGSVASTIRNEIEVVSFDRHFSLRGAPCGPTLEPISSEG